jgi:hypothetical protein
MRTFKRFVAFEKFDEDLREVWGDATVEEIDKQGEIVSFAGAVKAFTENAEYFQKASKGKSKGNVRAMHQPIAAGRIIAWEADERRKAIPIGTKIDDEKQWDLCKAGTYIGFSIAGEVTKEHKEEIGGREVNVIDEFNLVETSLVDHPANASCTFSIVKVAGGVTPTQSGSPAVPGTVPLTAVPDPEVEKAEEDPTTVQTLIFDKDKFSVEEAKKWATDHDFKASKVDEPESGDTIRIRQRDPGDFKGDMRTIELKDGVKAVIGHLKLAVPRFGKIVKALAPLFRKGGSEDYSIFPILCALRDLQSAMDSEAFGIAMGEDAAQEQADIRTLYDAVQSLLEFLGAEFAEEVQAFTSAEGAGQQGAFAMLDRLTSLQKALSPLQLRKVLDDDGMKENLDAIHRMGHGLVKASSAMGSDCPDGDCPPDDGEGDGDGAASGEGDGKDDGGDKPKEGDGDGAPPKDEGKKSASAGRLGAADGTGTKTILRALAKVEAGVGSVKESVEAFDARLKKIESFPAGIGRSPTTPVEKIIGAGGAAVAAVDLAAELGKLAEAEQDPMLKQRLALRAAAVSMTQIRRTAG